MSEYALPALPCLRLRLTLKALEPARLPLFHGSLLRGAFGHALRGAVCAMDPAQPCESCRLRTVCPYPRLFETLFEGPPPPLLRGQTTAPRPYVFEPGVWRESFAVGEELPFDLLLFGRPAQSWPYALLAVERMAAVGLGAGRHRFALERAEAVGPSGELRELSGADFGLAGEPLVPAPPAAFATPSGALRRLGLTFRTPLRLFSRGRPVRDLTFRALAFAMLRRVLELAAVHAPEASADWEFRPLLERADAIEITASDLAWHDWERYSQRQGRKVEMGGLVGTVELAGDLSPFAALLAAARVVHLGKGCTLGLGWVEVSA